MTSRLLAIALLLAAPIVLARASQRGANADGEQADGAAASRRAPGRDAEQGGTHWRLETSKGALHVWRPRGFRPADAATVIYLHGYYSDVDEAWRDHDLDRQFHASGRNALFVAAESPVSNADRVRWMELEALLHAVERAGIQVPRRQVVAVAHSGAFRTVVPWLRSPLLDEVILLDGLYNNLPDFAAWLRESPSRSARRLVLVGFETAERTEKSFLADFPDAKVRDGIPRLPAEIRRDERLAPLLYLRSQYGHMELVTEGRCIPMLLKMGSLPAL